MRSSDFRSMKFSTYLLLAGWLLAIGFRPENRPDNPRAPAVSPVSSNQAIVHRLSGHPGALLSPALTAL
jgi:hypothetical protein